MARSRDRLGLLLPIPALLAAESAPAHAAGVKSSAEAGAATAVHDATRGEPDGGPGLSPPRPKAEPGAEPELSPKPMPPPSWDERPPVDEEEIETRALFGEGQEAFERGEYREAAIAFSEAADRSPQLVTLRLNAVIMYRLATEAAAESDPEAAESLCYSTMDAVDLVTRHPDAKPAHAKWAMDEFSRVQDLCMSDMLGPCLSPPPPDEDVGPCLSVIPAKERGCSASARSAPTALLGSLMLLGLRSRRRRDAVEKMADRLPADVVARLRRAGDAKGTADD